MWEGKRRRRRKERRLKRQCHGFVSPAIEEICCRREAMKRVEVENFGRLNRRSDVDIPFRAARGSDRFLAVPYPYMKQGTAVIGHVINTVYTIQNTWEERYFIW